MSTLKGKSIVKAMLLTICMVIFCNLGSQAQTAPGKTVAPSKGKVVPAQPATQTTTTTANGASTLNGDAVANSVAIKKVKLAKAAKLKVAPATLSNSNSQGDAIPSSEATAAPQK